MDESPAVALRKKRNASIAVTARRVKEGAANAMVAAGSTGAAMTAALFNIGRVKGWIVLLLGLLPSMRTPTLMIDGGANADCPPELLVQFARLGQAYIQGMFNIERPKVGLLNIGSEEGKGNTFRKRPLVTFKHKTISILRVMLKVEISLLVILMSLFVMVLWQCSIEIS